MGRIRIAAQYVQWIQKAKEKRKNKILDEVRGDKTYSDTPCKVHLWNYKANYFQKNLTLDINIAGSLKRLA
jgi:hypothetical protein